MGSLLSGTLSPAWYLRNAGFDPFEWQKPVLWPSLTPKLLLTCRQAGKSTIIAGKVETTCRHEPNADALLICPSQDQSKEVMHKLSDFTRMHTSSMLSQDAVYEKSWINGSRVMALPGSERSVRGYSDPRFIILDEGARILDDTYKAALPMMAGGKTELIALSTAFGKRGWFYRAWTGKSDQVWDRIMVTVRWRLNEDETRLVEGPSESEMQELYARQGIKFFYSSRHTKEFCEFVLSEIGALWYRQEYQCEFLDMTTGVFSDALVQSAVTDDADILDLFAGTSNIVEEAELL